MKYIYALRVSCESSSDVSRVLGLESQTNFVNSWTCSVSESESDPPFDFIDKFLSILNGHYAELENLGITRSEISIWIYYEYDEQCNLEFSPESMMRLGTEGITLCISCWQK